MRWANIRAAACRPVMVALSALMLIAATEIEEPSAAALAHYTVGVSNLRDDAGPPAYDLAIEQFRLAIEVEPDWPEPYYSLGVAAERAGRFEEAAESLRTYLQLKPNARNADAVRSMISVLDDRIAHGLNRDAVIDLLAGLHDPLLWKRSPGNDAALRLVPRFRRSAVGVDALIERPAGQSEAVSIGISDDTRTVEISYYATTFTHPSVSPGCEGGSICQYLVSVSVVIPHQNYIHVHLSYYEVSGGESRYIEGDVFEFFKPLAYTVVQ